MSKVMSLHDAVAKYVHDGDSISFGDTNIEKPGREAVGKAITEMRANRPLTASWKAEVEADWRERK